MVLYAVPIWVSALHFLSFIGSPRYLAPVYPALGVFVALIYETLGRRLGKKAMKIPGPFTSFG